MPKTVDDSIPPGQPTAGTRHSDDKAIADFPFRSMIEALPALVLYVNSDGTVRYANPACAELLGRDVTGMQTGDIVGDRRELLAARKPNEAPLDGEPIRDEVVVSTSSGSPAIYDVQRLPDVGSDGTVRGYLVHAVDITDRKRAEQQLVVSRERFADFASTTSDWFWEMDADTNLTFFSTNRGSFANEAGSDVLDDLLRMFKPGKVADDDTAARYIDDVLNYRPLTDVRLTHNSDDDAGERYFSVNGKPCRDGNGTYVGYRGTVSEITNQVQAERAARDALLRAEQANVSKSRFLATASHDLRQPLQAIRLLNGSLHECVIADDIALNILRDSEHALQVMDSLLVSLLDMSKLESGIVVPEFRHIHVSSLFERLRAEFARSAEEKALRLIFAKSDAVVVTDRAMLESILRNLLTNALRYTEEGTVLVGCRNRGQNVRIEVWDTGVGIAEDHQAQIFDAFYQIGNPERDTDQGLGLGLAIIARLGELLRCPVDVRSQPGRGTVFSVTLPRGARAMAVRQGQALNPIRESWNLAGIHVLVIEDHPPTLRAMKKLLGLWNMDVVGARSGAAAMRQIQASHFEPDVIITDFRLSGGKTGVDALNQISGMLAPDIPVIFMTGDAMVEVRAALGEEFPHLLQKPVAPAKLRALIRNLLRQSPNHRANMSAPG